MAIPLRRVFRVAFVVARRPVLVRAGATIAAILLPAAIVFSPQGLSARDLVRSMAASWPLRAVVWAGWLALSAHAANAALTAPGMSVLRVARARRGHVVAALLVLASVVQAPWAVLWLRGAGPGAAFAAVTHAIALAASIFALTRRRELATGGILVAAATSALLGPLAGSSLAAFVGAGFSPLVGALLAASGMGRAWRVAAERSAEGAAGMALPRAGVLVVVHLLRLVRAERFRGLLATMIASLGASGLLTLRSDPTPRPVGRALAIMAVPLVLAASLFVAPLLDLERRLMPWLRSLRVRRWMIVASFFAALATPTSAFAATAGVAAGLVSPAPCLALGGALGAWAIVLSSVVGAWGRRHTSSFAVGVAAIAIAAAVAAMVIA
ncbi:MAG: hypothetical protein KIT84_42930 [Labilithrix sp.]|nr:hypothetical protein [Labilithrix sp.]MCW5817834.1 hypothetical protein [Labilithrix sp.]